MKDKIRESLEDFKIHLQQKDGKTLFDISGNTSSLMFGVAILIHELKEHGMNEECLKFAINLGLAEEKPKSCEEKFKGLLDNLFRR